MTISDFADRQINWTTEFLKQRQAQAKKEIPRPRNTVELSEDDQVQKYVEFRTVLSMAAQGDQESREVFEAVKKQLGLAEIADDILRVHPMFLKRVEDAS